MSGYKQLNYEQRCQIEVLKKSGFSQQRILDSIGLNQSSISIKRWTAKRKSALVLDIIQGKATVAEASRQFDLPPAEIEDWVNAKMPESSMFGMPTKRGA